MMTIQLTNTDFLPSESSYFEPPVVSITDCMRLRQYPLSDELTDELDRAIVVHPEHIPDDVVTMYARCAYIDERTGKTTTRPPQTLGGSSLPDAMDAAKAHQLPS